jgi:hypothetical protein
MKSNSKIKIIPISVWLQEAKALHAPAKLINSDFIATSRSIPGLHMTIWAAG